MEDEDAPDRSRRGLLIAGAGVAGAGIATAAFAAIGREDRGRQAGATTAPAVAPAVTVPGANGTGEGDDRAALQDAIDAAATEGAGPLRGGTVHVGAGVYPIGGSLHLRTGVTLRGAGPGTVIKLLPGVDEPALVIEANVDGTPVANAAVRDLTLDGATDEQTAGRHGIALRGNNRGGRTPYTGSDSFHLIADVLVAYFGGHGIALAVDPPDGDTPAEVRAARVVNAVVFECAKAARDGDRAGIFVGGTDGTLIGCDVAGSGGPGYLVTRANNRLDACKGYFNTDEFVVVGERNQLTGCQAQDSFGDGFVLRGAANSSLVGCQADSNAGAGFRLDGCRTVVVSGLTSFRRGERPAEGPGVVFAGGTERCLVSGTVSGFAVAVEGENPEGLTQIVS